MTQIISKKECRFAVYIAPPEYGMPDLHLIKEQIHDPVTGKVTPHLQLVENFQRKFWVTNKGSRNHLEKKEGEYIENLIEFKSTQSKLVESISKALGMPYFKGDLRKISASPFLYGSDILSTAVIKQAYIDRYPDLKTAASVATFDVETDVLGGTDKIIMATFTFKEIVFTAVVKSFVEGISNPEARVELAMKKYLGKYVLDRNIKSEIVFVDTEIDVIRATINKAHETKPDFLAIWNMDFDIGRKVIEACKNANVDPADIFCDPCIPKNYRFFTYKKGQTKKVTASGLETPIKPSAQWHTVFCPSSFYIIDAMCVYRQVRTGSAEKQSYSLDAILGEELDLGKLKFEEANKYTKLRWHQFMQSNYKIEYIIYNRFDCIAMELLDEKTLDLAVTLPLFAGCSDFSVFNSQPRRKVDDLHYYFLKNGRVIGTTCSKMAKEEDAETLGLEGWIITLPAHPVADNGLQIIAEHPELRTNIRGHVADLDVSASYPNGQCVFNISKETTVKEIIRIEGVNSYTSRMQSINLSGGLSNSVEFCSYMFKFPKLSELTELYAQV